MNSFHLSNSSEWYTPIDVIQSTKKLLHTIDLDPASSIEANKYINASKIFTKKDNGLKQNWNINNDEPINIFCNPPSGKIGKYSLPILFWKKLMNFRETGNLNHAIFIAFSLEQFQISQNYRCLSMLDFPFCVPNKRLKFIKPKNKLYIENINNDSPTHSNAIIYIDGIENNNDIFYDCFNRYGKIANY